MLNLSVILENSARRYPTKEAFVFDDNRLNYAQIDGGANQIASGLKSIGIQPGDTVAISCPNLPYFPILYFGILKAGAVVVPLSILLKREEISYHLTDSDAKAYFCFLGTDQLPMAEEGHAGFQNAPACEQFFLIMPQLEEASAIEGVETMGNLMEGQPTTFPSEPANAEDTAVIIYTSGTTGRPKGAELTHSNLLLNAILAADLATIKPEDVQLIALPLFHIFAMTVLMNAGIYKAASHVLQVRFDAEVALGLMKKQGVTIFAGVPTMYWGLLHSPIEQKDVAAITKKLRICISGGAALPLNVLEEFEAKFEVPIIEGYGMSESSPVVTFNQLQFGRKPGSIGLPVWGVEVMVADENDNPLPAGEKGELLYRGHNVMKGYYKRPEENKKTLRGGWMHSGDIAVMDEDGYFYIVDRTKDMIIRGGFNVYPREVEEVMIKHVAISLVAVIGVPDEKFGEEIKACVVLKEGASASAEEIIAWTKAHIASYKYPRLVHFMDALPMSATGKILKKELRKIDSLIG